MNLNRNTAYNTTRKTLTTPPHTHYKGGRPCHHVQCVAETARRASQHVSRPDRVEALKGLGWSALVEHCDALLIGEMPDSGFNDLLRDMWKGGKGG